MSYPTPIPGIVYSRIDQIWNEPIPAGSLVCSVRTPVHQLVIDCCPEVSGELRFVDDEANCLITSSSSAGPFAQCLNKRDKEGVNYSSAVCTASPEIVPDMDPEQQAIHDAGKAQMQEGQSRFSESWAKHGFTSPIIQGGAPGQGSQAKETSLPGKPDPIPGVDFDPLTGNPIAIIDGEAAPAQAGSRATSSARRNRGAVLVLLASLAMVGVTM